METAASIDIAELLENERLGPWHVAILLLCFLVLFVDGMDFSAVSVAAPAILRAWHAKKDVMGIVFGIGNLGILVGTLIFSRIGDWYGRRPGVLYAVLSYSVPALMIPFVKSPAELAILRFAAGLGIGGVIPNLIALLTESAPKALRSSFVIIPFTGYAFGSAAAGGLAAWLIPEFGWPSIFIAAGVSGVLLAGILGAFLPESLRFLALARPHAQQLRRRVAKLRPGIVIGPDTRFELRHQARTAFTTRLLFQGGHRIATPLLWLAFFAEALTFMSIIAWLPVLLETARVSAKEASLTFAYGAIGGLVGNLAIARLLDKFGLAAATVVGLFVILAFGVFGMAGLSVNLLIAVAILMVAGASTTHNALNGVVGTFYPTNIRVSAVGYAIGMGRFAAVIGPVLAGFLIAARLKLEVLCIVMVSPYLLVVLACTVLAWRFNAQIARDAIGDASTPETSSEEAFLQLQHLADPKRS